MGYFDSFVFADGGARCGISATFRSAMFNISRLSHMCFDNLLSLVMVAIGFTLLAVYFNQCGSIQWICSGLLLARHICNVCLSIC